MDANRAALSHSTLFNLESLVNFQLPHKWITSIIMGIVAMYER
ncbi:unnamed protein product [Rhodiola kirilowii]